VAVESDADKIAVVSRWVEAYNSLDNETMKSLLGDGLRIRHHNRGVDLQGGEAMIEILENFEGITENKKFGAPTRQFVAGDIVVTEHPWQATFKVDVPGFADAGETAELDLCSIWEIRDGKIVEYDDYG
jgi:limonene-1,2-epoxide hydrolase